MLEGERGCLNHVTCLPFHLTAAPLGNSLFTLLSGSLCCRETGEGMMGKQERGVEDAVGRVPEVEEGRRQNEVVEKEKGEKG